MSLQLNMVRLRSLNVERPLEPGILASLVKAEMKADIEFEFGDKLSGPAEGALPDPGTSHAYWIWPEVRFKARLAETADPKAIELAPDIVWQATAQFEVEYHLGADVPGLPHETASGLIVPSVHFQVWPYMRELMNSLAVRSGMQLPMLPLLKTDPQPEYQNVG